MTYGLSRLVSIWMSLYYNLPSLRLWHNQTGKNPTINECLHYLGEEQQTRGRNAALYKKVSTMFNRLTEFGCKNTSSLLESSWRSALATKSIPFSEPISAVSLIDFPRYLGASWPHNDIALYFPQLKKTAVMKISDSRFRPLREKLMVVTQGLDPFIGTAFSVRYTKLHPLFNRVRCSRALPIEVGSFRRLTTFSEQLNMLHGSYIPTSELGSILEGSASLNLGNYIIARYSNAYALWQFATSDAVLKSSKRDNDYNYTLKVDVNGIEASAWIFRNALFDSEVEPNNYVGKKVRLGGFVLIGHSAIQDYRESIHVLSIAPADDLQDQKATQENYNTYSVPLTVSIKTIEEELLDLNKRIYHTKKEVIFEEDTVEQQVMSEEVPKALKPQARIVGETELPADQWRVLVIMNSNRNRGFDVHEITKRLQYESGSHYSLESVRSILQQLCDKNLALMNVFGDRWYIDPTVKVITADVKLSEAAVEPIVLDYLKKYIPSALRDISL